MNSLLLLRVANHPFILKTYKLLIFNNSIIIVKGEMMVYCAVWGGFNYFFNNARVV